ncbi:23S rRNA (guanine(745)-N(1))-methyltransferase [Colwellia sp. MEBiC06753]
MHLFGQRLTSMLPHYSCPICQNPLVLTANIFRCQDNHPFDLAKENYVNLLPVQFKHSKNPGDNKAMVNARRAFLEQGYYQPLVDFIVARYQQYIEGKHNQEHYTVLDAGCGEGYYTHQHKFASNQVYGVDIAKEAIKKAGKKYKNCHFSVGTLSKLAFADQTFDWLFSVYAPILEDEFSRVLKSGGYLLTVTPAQNHLIELKQKIYDNALAHDETRQPIQHLKLVDEHHLSYVMTITTGQDLLNLLSMTPFAFKATEQVKHWLAQQTNFKCQADFLIRLYKKCS